MTHTDLHNSQEFQRAIPWLLFHRQRSQGLGSQPQCSFSLSLDTANDRIHETLLIGQHASEHKEVDSEHQSSVDNTKLFKDPVSFICVLIFCLIFRNIWDKYKTTFEIQ